MPLAVDAAAPGPRAEAQPPNLETRECFGVAHKGSALKVSRGLNFTFQGDDICHERGVPTTRYTQATIIGISGSGIAQPASPIKRVMRLQAQTPGFHCPRTGSGGGHGHSTVVHSNTQTPQCSVYAGGLLPRARIRCWSKPQPVGVEWCRQRLPRRPRPPGHPD